METLHFTLETDLSLAATVSSRPIKMDRFSKISVQAVWATGSSPVGNFTLQVCNDEGRMQNDGTVTGLTSWDTITGSTVAAGGAAGSNTWDVQTAARWMRVTYTRASGSTTVTYRVSAKGV